MGKNKLFFCFPEPHLTLCHMPASLKERKFRLRDALTRCPRWNQAGQTTQDTNTVCFNTPETWVVLAIALHLQPTDNGVLVSACLIWADFSAR